MIRVKKVVGETFDLETGQGFSKGLVLVNDKGTSVTIEVTEEDVGAVLELMADERDNSPGPYRTAKVPEGSPTDLVAAFDEAVADTAHISADNLENGYYGPESFGGQDYENGPASDEDDYDPGETYGDASSGLPSI